MSMGRMLSTSFLVLCLMEAARWAVKAEGAYARRGRYWSCMLMCVAWAGVGFCFLLDALP